MRVLNGRVVVDDHRMRLRIELFVDDMDASVAFYRDLLGFRVGRRTEDYASLGRGLVVLGLGPVAKLPKHGGSHVFTRQRLGLDKGAGVEIVLELDGLDQVVALYEHCREHGGILEALQLQPWGLHDFRVTDPDGYYLRITHGSAGTEDSALPT